MARCAIYAHLRRIVSDSFELSTYEPHSKSDWDAAAVGSPKLVCRIHQADSRRSTLLWLRC